MKNAGANGGIQGRRIPVEFREDAVVRRIRDRVVQTGQRSGGDICDTRCSWIENTLRPDRKPERRIRMKTGEPVVIFRALLECAGESRSTDQ